MFNPVFKIILFYLINKLRDNIGTLEKKKLSLIVCLLEKN